MEAILIPLFTHLALPSFSTYPSIPGASELGYGALRTPTLLIIGLHKVKILAFGATFYPSQLA